jgi:hypothetical protein
MTGMRPRSRYKGAVIISLQLATFALRLEAEGNVVRAMEDRRSGVFPSVAHSPPEEDQGEDAHKKFTRLNGNLDSSSDHLR